MSAFKGDLSVDLQPLPPAWPLVESRCVGVVLLRSDEARPPGVLTERCGLERARAPVWPSAAGRAGRSSAISTPWVVEARSVDAANGSTRAAASFPILLGLRAQGRRRSPCKALLHRAAARTCRARPCWMCSTTQGRASWAARRAQARLLTLTCRSHRRRRRSARCPARDPPTLPAFRPLCTGHRPTPTSPDP